VLAAIEVAEAHVAALPVDDTCATSEAAACVLEEACVINAKLEEHEIL